MELVFKDGDILTCGCEVIAHQINGSGGFNTGVAGAIKSKYPEIAEQYHKTYNEYGISVGNCYFWNTNDGMYTFANLCSQKKYGYGGGKYTSYDALDEALRYLVEYCSGTEVHTIAFPYGMSSVRGGANWNIVLKMIEEAFKHLDIRIEIWKL